MFWEDMRVWQMGELMLIKNEKVLDFWKKLSDSVEKKPDGTKISNDDWKESSKEQLNFVPIAPAGYFLTHIAAICGAREKAAEEFAEDSEKSMEWIGEEYLNHAFLNKNNTISGWKYTLSLFLYNDKDQEERASTCWNHIWKRVKDESKGFTSELTLKELLDKILKANKEANNKEINGMEYERRINEESIEHLKGHLKNYSTKIMELWEEFGETKQFTNLCVRLCNGIKQIILTGAPGTGKTYIAEKAAELLGSPLPQTEEGPQPKKKRYYRVQFHPSYDYTDFVEGLRPIEGEDGKLSFVKKDGHFKKFCRDIVKKNKETCPEKEGKDDPGRKYFFLIDEINRADLSKVFGELMFCLESDKRGERVQTQYQTLPTYDVNKEEDVFSDGFFIPKNVYIIGTMNDIDRSVESMDFALRRRFVFCEIEVEETLLIKAFQSGNFGELLQKNAKKIAEQINALNKVIYNNEEGEEDKEGKELGLNKQYNISQGQFTGLPEEKNFDELREFVWKYRLEPLLREYVRGEDITKVDAFILKCQEKFGVESKS